MSKSAKVTAVMPEDLKDSLKTFADSKRWTMSQAVAYLVEKGLSEEAKTKDSGDPQAKS